MGFDRSTAPGPASTTLAVFGEGHEMQRRWIAFTSACGVLLAGCSHTVWALVTWARWLVAAGTGKCCDGHVPSGRHKPNAKTMTVCGGDDFLHGRAS